MLLYIFIFLLHLLPVGELKLVIQFGPCLSVLWHSWLDHMTCKIVPKMTYNVSIGTLKPGVSHREAMLSLRVIWWTWLWAPAGFQTTLVVIYPLLPSFWWHVSHTTERDCHTLVCTVVIILHILQINIIHHSFELSFLACAVLCTIIMHCTRVQSVVTGQLTASGFELTWFSSLSSERACL